MVATLARVRTAPRRAAATLLVCAVGATAATAAAEPAACLSPDPAKWPAPSKPYFMVAFDTSGSMTSSVAASNSCGYPNDRLGHGRCALKNTLLAFAGQASFGLATYARAQSGCQNNCFSKCSYSNLPNNSGSSGCGPRPGDATTRAGANLVVPMLVDHYWASPPAPSNVPALVSWVDNQCAGNAELFADGSTPLNGMLRDMFRYYSVGWTHPSGAPSYPSPLGKLADGERPCRSVNVVLVTDGDETCDTQADATAAAAALYAGFTKDGITWRVRTFVINFAGASKADTDAIAAAGGTGSSYVASDQTTLAQALANVIGGAIRPEVCDNADNDCNGCTDEGYVHYCDVGQTCCAWATPAQRDACLAGFQASVTPQNPTGDLGALPCTTALQQADPATWLCVDPRETCDLADNNCDGQVDEGVTRCGSPPHCPAPEACNGVDDDCNGQIDDGVCGGCVPSPEICDGCDNDCDGVADDGVAPVPCGLANPPSCAGTMACKPPQVVPKGTCAPGGGFAACANAPQPETCNGKDDDCDGVVDDGVPATACVPNGVPGGLVYGGASQCVKGTQPCGGACTGFVGPSPEICDGVDNDCDGVVDDGAIGAGVACGNPTPPCKAGTTACVAGALTCQGAVGPQPETCNGVDDDCNGQVDEAPLADAPPQGQGGCWLEPGNCCAWKGASWCPPAGATCTGRGALTAPCNQGALTCQGAAGWACVGAKAPSPEACDGLDDDCDGTVDDGVPGVGQACGSDVGACASGTVTCAGGKLGCTGDVGPTSEVCNGVDDDCDGVVDDGVPGAGAPCGNATPPCKQGAIACVGGQLVCQGAVGPGLEVCNGVDDDCDGAIDDGVLADAPAQNGCWDLPGDCCTFAGLSWCPPPGAGCFDKGALAAPCAKGTLVCGGSKGYQCVGAKGPQAETCNGVDDDCDGLADDVPPTPCVPAGQPQGLVFGAPSQCKMGLKSCGACVGFVGPSAEVCDGVDNDCDGKVDDDVTGLGKPCGVSQPPCTPGATVCVGGAVVCAGGAGPTPETCNGVDDDCNGKVDDGPLGDAPDPQKQGCWHDPGDCCSFASLTWCPPAGATCDGEGTLTAPCSHGTLACAGAKGWVCQGGRGPLPEGCDGLDNDCDGQVDDGALPDVGTTCGIDVGECLPGVVVCAAGVLACAGGSMPTPEVCDGKDNDCDGVVDDGIPAGGPCTPPYDAGAYPGPRTGGACRPGVLECDGHGGLVCKDGVGPTPELCNGLDDDCDGKVDEAGPAPDGVDGTENPFAPPEARLGEPCGIDTGLCEKGAWACVKGSFACLGATPASDEVCDCGDNDCDGAVDEPNEGGPALCSAGKECVKSAGGCGCAAKCQPGEYPCPAGQTCEKVTSSRTGADLGFYCIPKSCPDDCSVVTRTTPQGDVVCAPPGTVLEGCVTPPTCACKGQHGCDDPCVGVTCEGGLVCSPWAKSPGTCVVDNCWGFPCQGCGRACHLGSCVDSPCEVGSCAPGEVCKPSADFTSATCVPSCAGVACPKGEACEDGACVRTCDPPCAAPLVCDPSASPPACVPSRCDAERCKDGSCCDPVTGACGDCPCEGVVCPAGQACQAGECALVGGHGGSGGSGGATGGSGAAAADAGPPAAAKASSDDERVWGLATGGGGCACEVGAGGARGARAIGLVVALVAAVAARRRRRAARREVAR